MFYINLCGVGKGQQAISNMKTFKNNVTVSTLSISLLNKIKAVVQGL